MRKSRSYNFCLKDLTCFSFLEQRDTTIFISSAKSRSCKLLKCILTVNIIYCWVIWKNKILKISSKRYIHLFIFIPFIFRESQFLSGRKSLTALNLFDRCMTLIAISSIARRLSIYSMFDFTRSNVIVRSVTCTYEVIATRNFPFPIRCACNIAHAI